MALELSISEIVPLTAEFLFCGESRESLFADLTSIVLESYQGEDKLLYHGDGWSYTLKFLLKELGEDQNLENWNRDKLLEKIGIFKDKSEVDKIKIVKAIRENVRARE